MDRPTDEVKGKEEENTRLNDIYKKEKELDNNSIEFTYALVTRYFNGNPTGLGENELIEIYNLQSSFSDGDYSSLLKHAKAISNILNRAIKVMGEKTKADMIPQASAPTSVMYDHNWNKTESKEAVERIKRQLNDGYIDLNVDYDNEEMNYLREIIYNYSKLEKALDKACEIMAMNEITVPSTEIMMFEYWTLPMTSACWKENIINFIEKESEEKNGK